jgi:lipid II:glycine glycyltransferase (peptidoglycan interpeptide bridge formation enzyme)
VPVAGAVFFHFGKTAIYKFGASNEAFQHLRANNLVMWEAIKWHAMRGFAVLDFGRTSLGNEGLRRFKLGWGTRERRIDYFRYDQRKSGFVTARDESSGWHNRIFRILPVSLSRLVGAASYRHVA